MENPEKPNLEIVRRGRPKGVTQEVLADRAARIRGHLKNGFGRREICLRENLTLAEYRSAMRWLGKIGSDNWESFASFMVGEQSRLEEIETDIESARTKGDMRAVAALHRVAADIHRGIYDMALKLGVLQREAIRIEARRVEVSFGDEKIRPWFATDPEKPS